VNILGRKTGAKKRRNLSDGGIKRVNKAINKKGIADGPNCGKGRKRNQICPRGTAGAGQWPNER